MQISTLQTYFNFAQKSASQNFQAFPDDTGSSAAAGDSKTASTSDQQVNFSSMSRNDLRDWINVQLKAGKISPDDAFSLAAMTMHIPVDGSSMGDDMDQPIDFTADARSGLEGALQRGDKTTEDMLSSVLKILTGR